MPYFVVYKLYVPTWTPEQVASERVHNVILRKRHPIEWAANPGQASKDIEQITYLLFFAKISTREANSAARWCSVE